MEYYSALKRKEILTQAATWMNLEGIVLSETGHSQNGPHLGEVPSGVRLIEMESSMVAAEGWEW